MKKYIRKTRDTWQVQGCYGGEWCLECNNDTRMEAVTALHEYRDNLPNTSFRIKKIRERKED